MSPAVSVRVLETGDRAPVVELHRAAFDEALAFDELVLQRLFQHERAINLVAELDEALVGFASAIHGQLGARLFTIHVDEAARGKGVGKALLEEIERRLTARKARHLELYVHTENQPAIELYQGLGYEIVQEDPDRYPSLETSSGYVMRKPLR